MTAYYGDIKLGDTIDIEFTTTTSAGVPTTLAGSPVISAYIGNSTTQLTAGITLTVDFDGITGRHNVRLVATTGNGYAAATNISLVITTGTVSGVSVVGYGVGDLSIENRVVNIASLPVLTGPYPAIGIVDSGTAQAATGTTIQLRAAATFADNTVIGSTILAFGSTQGYWQSRVCTAYVGATDTATVDTWAVTPSGTVTYIVMGTAPVSSTGVSVNAASVRSAVGMASANLDTQLGGISTGVSNLSTRTPTALIGGRMDSNVGSVATVVVQQNGTGTQAMGGP